MLKFTNRIYVYIKIKIKIKIDVLYYILIEKFILFLLIN